MSQIKELIILLSFNTSRGTDVTENNISKAVNSVNEAVLHVQREPLCLIIATQPPDLSESESVPPVCSHQAPAKPAVISRGAHLKWQWLSDSGCLNWEVLRQLTLPILSWPDEQPHCPVLSSSTRGFYKTLLPTKSTNPHMQSISSYAQTLKLHICFS